VDLLALGSVTLTSLVGLVTQFAGERRHAVAMTAEEFKAWLAENRHDDVVRLLEQNAHSLLAVRIMLSQDRTELFTQLAEIDRKLAIIVGGMKGFAQVASVIHPYARVSRDGKRFLRDFDRTGASKALEFANTQAHLIVPVDAPPAGQQMELRGGWRFFEDDIAIMVEAGLLLVSRDRDGRRALSLTRDGSDFARSVDTEN